MSLGHPNSNIDSAMASSSLFGSTMVFDVHYPIQIKACIEPMELQLTLQRSIDELDRRSEKKMGFTMKRESPVSKV